MFLDVLTVIEGERMMPLPFFCQLNFIGKSDEAAQVKIASDPGLIFASFRPWVMVGGSEERVECSS